MTKTRELPITPLAQRRGLAAAVVAACALALALALSADPAYAQESDAGNVAESPSAQEPQNAGAENAEEGASATQVALAAADESNNPKSSEGDLSSTDQYQADVVVGDKQKCEYDGEALDDDEYYVEVTYDADGKVVRYHASDKDDVAFSFFTEAGDSLEGPPVNAGVYGIQAQILATEKHSGRLLEKVMFEITKKIVPAPAPAKGLAYNGKEQTGVEGTDLFTVEGGSATEAGHYTARATLKDQDNYVFEGQESLGDQNGGFIDIAWAIAEASTESARDEGYSWEVTPADSDLTFGSVTARTAPSHLMADIMAFRDRCIDRLSSMLLHFIKFTRQIFPGLGL